MSEIKAKELSTDFEPNEDVTLTLVQSNEFLCVKMESLSKAARHLLSFLYYSIGQETPAMLEKIGYDAWNSNENRMVDYNIDLEPFYKLPIIKNTYEPYGIRKTFAEAITELVGWPLTFFSEDGTEINIAAFISIAKIDAETGGSCTLSISREVVSMLVPELIKQREISESHRLSIVQTFGFKSKYSEKIYIYINGKIQSSEYLSMKTPVLRVPVITLKKLLAINDNTYYSKNAVFMQKILDPSLEEINRVSDIDVKYRTVRDGRYIRWIEFYDISRDSMDGTVFDRKEETPITETIEKNMGTDSSGRQKIENIFSTEEFAEAAQEDGFTISQILELYMLYNGDVNRLLKARSTFKNVCDAGLVSEEKRFAFYRSVI